MITWKGSRIHHFDGSGGRRAKIFKIDDEIAETGGVKILHGFSQMLLKFISFDLNCSFFFSFCFWISITKMYL